ncbi:MAG: Rrf2 family transcriptional regulator [Lachnospiraceae bacterium]|nr:Rrf2 family transcriptional regulator [Lachnospiraceae bacterium]
MKISTKGRYAVRLMLDLSEHYTEGYIALKDVADRQEISKKYLEQIIPYLNRGQLLLTNRGHQGGYKLAKHPSEITIFEVLTCAEGDLAPVSCLQQGAEPCDRRGECLTFPIWDGLNKLVSDYLKGITLQDVLNNRPDAPEYNI